MSLSDSIPEGRGCTSPTPVGGALKREQNSPPPPPRVMKAKRKLVSSSERILPCVGDKTKAALLALQRTKEKRGNLEGGREAREKSCFIHSLHCRFLFGMANQGRETTKTTEKTLNCEKHLPVGCEGSGTCTKKNERTKKRFRSTFKKERENYKRKHGIGSV